MSEEKKYYYVEGILHEWEYPDQLVPADTMNLVCPKCSARAGFDARWCGINCLSGGVACQWYKSVEKLTQNEFNLLSDRASLLAVARAATELDKLMYGVGEETDWKDGIETDRVFSWSEFIGLHLKLAALSDEVKKEILK